MKSTALRSKQAGVTMAEVVVASAVSGAVLTFVVSLFLVSAASWARGESRIDGETNARQAVRIVSDELREAMWVSVDANGMGVTYRIPAKETTGEFKVPAVWDGKDRRIELKGTNLVLEEDADTSRVIARNVITKDPFQTSNHVLDSAITQQSDSASWPSYKIFESNIGALTTEVKVSVVIANRGGKTGEYVRTRKRELISLRNVPELIK